MYEQQKIDEAAYFLARMGATASDPKSFRYELSAFLAAARSSVQYALREASSKPGGQKWYEAQINRRPIVAWFKDKRDINIHQQPVVPNTDVTITVSEAIHISDSLSLKLMNSNGNVLQEKHVGADAEPHKAPSPPADVAYRHRFPDWPGPEDVLTLSAKYLVEIEEMVTDGFGKGHLS